MSSDRRNILSRRNKGRLLRPSVIEFLDSAFDECVGQWAFVSLEESDAVWKTFQAKRKEYGLEDRSEPYKFCRQSTEKADVFSYVSAVAQGFPHDREVFLFLPQWEYCGALKAALGLLVQSAERIIRVDQEDLLACDNSGSVGLVLESFTHQSNIHYRFLAWNEQINTN